MDEKIERIIGNISDLSDLFQFEENAMHQEALSPEVKSAIDERAIELGVSIVQEKTGLNLESLSPAEKKIIRAVSEYNVIKKRKGSGAWRTFGQLKHRGLIEAAEKSVIKSKPTQGYEELAEADLSDLSYEQIIVDHPEEFSPRALWYARRTLGLSNENDKPPAESTLPVQERTEQLLNWLKDRSAKEGGYPGGFSNAEAASALGMDDLSRHGQAYGNIQSRIDFACYLANLPPLGLCAEAPFDKAWGQDEREWTFPIRQMIAAAQSRVWRDSDFEVILQHTRQLPGQAYVSWKKELSEQEQKVKSWAFGLEPQNVTSAIAPSANGEKKRKNPNWSRDELILALDLYMDVEGQLLDDSDDRVIALSELLNSLYKGDANQNFRNPNGVSMKLANFSRFDPQHIAEGRKGLTRGSKADEEVWNDFSADVAKLKRVANSIRGAASSNATVSLNEDADDSETSVAKEGKILTRLHRSRERSPAIVKKKKKSVLQKTGQLACEVCSFDFKKRYGDHGEGFIECHHIKPLSEYDDEKETKLSDLALVCSNCHRMIHARKNWLTVEELKKIISKHS